MIKFRYSINWEKILIIFLFIFATGCSTYTEVPYIVGEENFTISSIKKEASFLKENLLYNESYSNLPKKLSQGPRSSKKWDIIISKYKADLEYSINKFKGEKYIIRRVDKWPEDEDKPIKDPEGFFEYLRKKGITDYKVIKQDVWEFKNEEPIKVILLLYKGVKNEVKIKSTYITVTSYKLEDKDYWESQGQFMLDTPINVFEKYKNVNR